MLGKYRLHIINVLIRIVSLVTKLGLTFYMGKYCSLSDLGIYGLVFSAVMILGTVMGIHIDYIVSREIVGKSPLLTLRMIRDEGVFYALNFAVLAIFTAIAALMPLYHHHYRILLYTFAITVGETIATTCYTNMNSMGQQLQGNMLFFLRSGLWALLIMLPGIFLPAFRSIDVILMAWILGLAGCLAGTLWSWRNLPWSEVRKIPVDWNWIRQSIRKSVFVWIGGLGLIVGGYADRFVVDHFLGLEMVGVATFYGSFVAGVLTLLQSGVFAFSSPRMITLYQEKNRAGFWQEVKNTAWHAALFSAFICIGVAIAVPWFGKWLKHPEFVDQVFTLWLMLFAIFIRIMGQVLYCILFARGQDYAVWKGDLLFVIPAIGGNLLLLQFFALPAIGYTAILAALILFGWRLWHVVYYHETAF